MLLIWVYILRCCPRQGITRLTQWKKEHQLVLSSQVIIYMSFFTRLSLLTFWNKKKSDSCTFLVYSVFSAHPRFGLHHKDPKWLCLPYRLSVVWKRLESNFTRVKMAPVTPVPITSPEPQPTKFLVTYCFHKICRRFWLKTKKTNNDLKRTPERVYHHFWKTKGGKWQKATSNPQPILSND